MEEKKVCTEVRALPKCLCKCLCRKPIQLTLQLGSTMSASSNSHRDDDHSIAPHFFKVILQETIRDGILGIPRKFVGKYGHQLSGTVKLEVPSGAIWQVELTKTDGRMLLEKGWREFAEYYSLEVGSFLVFRYKGNGHFHVLIFDKSASEIKYAYFAGKVDVSGKSTEKSHLPCPLPRKRTRTDPPSHPVTNSKLEVLPAGNSFARSNSCRINRGNLQEVEKSLGQLDAQRSVKTVAFSYVQIGLTAIEKAHVVQVASAFESTGNPVFVAVMKPSYVYHMCIPGDFARKFLPMHNCDLTLVNSAAKTWPVKYCYNAENKIPQAKLCGGWRVFVDDNHICAGNTCVFELIKDSEIIIKVIINPVVENARKAYRPQAHGNIAGRVKTRNLLGDTKPNSQQSSPPSSSRKMEDPADSYIEVLNDSLLNQKTKKKLISSSFEPCKVMRTKPSGSTQAEGIRLDREKKSMKYQYLTKEFDADADKSASEIKYANFTRKVDVSAKSTEKSHLPCPLPRKRTRTDSPNQPVANSKLEVLPAAQRSVKTVAFSYVQIGLTAIEKAHVVQVARAFESTGNPVFVAVMKPSFVCYKYHMCIPGDFARKFLPMHNCDLTLVNSAAKTWPVKYCYNAEDKIPQAKLCGGWRVFVEDNHLCAGDTCVFELIKDSKIIIKVIINPVVENARKAYRPQAHGNIAGRVKTRNLLGDTKPNSQQSSPPSSSRKMEDPADLYIEVLNDSLKQKAYIGATGFRTSNPCFSVVMQPSYVHSCNPVNIPEEFVNGYLQENGEVILKVPDGRTWTVDCETIPTDGRQSAKFCGNNWRKFVIDNELKVGDVCIFELIKENGNLLDVFIQRKLLLIEID